MNGKVVLITGASSGIGLALAAEFARQGSHLVLGARSADALAQVAAHLARKHPGIRVLHRVCDVTQPAQCQALVQAAQTELGRLDVLVCNAGISMTGPVAQVSLDVLHRVMDTNFWGTVHCVQAALPLLQASRGSVVGISSIAGYLGLPERSGYSASKFAMHGFLQSLRIEHLHEGLHVLLACPGFTASNIRERALTAWGAAQGTSPQDEGKMMTAEEAARHIYYATRRRRRTLVLTRQGKLTVLVQKLLPAFVEAQARKTFDRIKANARQAAR
jgi:short-subunit dehydrogenase